MTPSAETNGTTADGAGAGGAVAGLDSGSTEDGQRAALPLEIIIIGAGLGGIALAGVLGHSGHKVTVLEAAPSIGEIGAGIAAMPNLTRLLSRWGLDKYIRKHTQSMGRINLLRWQNGEYLGAAILMPEIEQKYGAPQYCIHRADLHSAIMEDARTVAEICVDSKVVDIDFEKPSVTLQNGKVLEADLVVGADGLKSVTRQLMYEQLGLVDKAIPTGDAAFRASILIDKITDPELRAFVSEHVGTRWMGPERHIQGYPIRHNGIYNMVLCHPDNGSSVEDWNARASKQEILDEFGTWDPKRLGKLLELIPDQNVMKWQLCSHNPLPTWVMGKVVLLGDACHPMLPYVGQGAGQAIEDVGVLRLALNRLSTREELPVLLKTYEVARKPRAEQIISTSDTTRIALHLPDGPQQQARDEKFRAVAQGGDNPDLLGDSKAQQWLWGYDPEKEFLKNYDALRKRAEEEMSAPPEVVNI